ncbi:hypothetical protein AK972_3209 [Pseudomonas yamanorum]|nr:hypothetical protein AK972_3209 [Pseudomonas yamanorum]
MGGRKLLWSAHAISAGTPQALVTFLKRRTRASRIVSQ